MNTMFGLVCCAAATPVGQASKSANQSTTHRQTRDSIQSSLSQVRRLMGWHDHATPGEILYTRGSPADVMHLQELARKARAARFARRAVNHEHAGPNTCGGAEKCNAHPNFARPRSPRPDQLLHLAGCARPIACRRPPIFFPATGTRRILKC